MWVFGWVYNERARATIIHSVCFASSVAKFVIPDWGNKVDSGIGLSYRPARLHTMQCIGWQAGMTTLYARVNYIPQSGTMNFATGPHINHIHSNKPNSSNLLKIRRQKPFSYQFGMRKQSIVWPTEESVRRFSNDGFFKISSVPG
jgi:hypothetical protein